MLIYVAIMSKGKQQVPADLLGALRSTFANKISARAAKTLSSLLFHVLLKKC